MSHDQGAAKASWSKSNLPFAAMGVLIVLAFGLAAYSEAMMMLPIDDSDEGGYMAESLWIADRGHAPGFIRACWAGEYPYCQRHPLAQMLASPLVGRSLEHLRRVRALKVALSAAGLGLVLALAFRMMRPPAALLMIALLALSGNWYAKARVFTAEPLIYVFFFLAWSLIAGRQKTRWRWPLAGAAWGLSYLAKGTALLLTFALPLAWAAYACVRRLGDEAFPARKTVLRFALKACLPFLIAAVVFGGPLLIRNTVRFGNPIRNLSSSCMWLDSWADHVSLYQDPPAPAPTFLSYVRTHSLRQMIARVSFGMKKQVPRFLGGFACERGFGEIAWHATLAVSAAIILLGTLAALRDYRSWSGVYTLCLLIVSACLFSWYSYITYASRFMATLAPIVGVYALSDARKLTPRADARLHDAVRRLALPAACIALLLLGFRTRWRDLCLPRGPVPTTPEYRFLLEWYNRRVAAPRAVCFQTPNLAPRYQMGWLRNPGGRAFHIPNFKTIGELQEYMDARGARYLIIERDSLKERLPLLSPYFGVTKDNALEVRRPLPGWRPHAQDPYPPLDFVILERDRKHSAPSPPPGRPPAMSHTPR